MGIKEDWQRGMSYEDLHVKYLSPIRNCECAGCDAARAREWDEDTRAELEKSPRDDLALPVSYPEAPINDPAPTGDDPWRPCQTPEEYERRRKNEN